MPSSSRQRSDFRVALVYPPFGPSGIASLGLALLSAGLKAAALRCTTVYWNLELITAMPGSDLAERLRIYRALTNRHAMPFNEWTFAELVHGDALRHRENVLRAELSDTMTSVYGRSETRRRVAETLLSLRDSASDHLDRLVGRLEPFDLVGINSTFFQNLPALALAKRVKQRWPDKCVVIGGANCDGEMGPALAEKFPFLDAVFVGEADRSFPDFVARVSRGDSFGDIAGIAYRDNHAKLRLTAPAAPLSDLDSLPVPDFDDFVRTRQDLGIDALHELTLPLESSRGCWWGARHHCTFCGLNANGMGYRQKTAERFEAELEQVSSRYGARYIFMTDNILSMDYYGGFMERAAAANRPVRLFYEIKANANRNQVAQLASAGISGVQPGIESFSSSVLALMRKGTTGIQNIAFLKYAREYGLFVAYNILVNFPREDAAEYDRLAPGIRALVHLQPPSGLVPIEYHRFSPYHASPSQFGLHLRPSAKYAHLYPFPEEDIGRIAYLFEDREPSALPDYLSAFAEQLRLWHEAYDGEDCALTWEPNGLDIVVTDRRPGFPAARLHLRQHAAEVFRSLDRPKSLGLVVSEARGAAGRETVAPWLAEIFAEPASEADKCFAFTAEEFADDPHSRMAELAAAGLVFAEGDRFLALPVRATYKVPDLGWLSTGV
jgi:ribosomal peptide maturation radical SAM protein 1